MFCWDHRAITTNDVPQGTFEMVYNPPYIENLVHNFLGFVFEIVEIITGKQTAIIYFLYLTFFIIFDEILDKIFVPY